MIGIASEVRKKNYHELKKSPYASTNGYDNATVINLRAMQQRTNIPSFVLC
ncbi:hypothetical protein PHMEG_00035055 [Phytophthora megakarya]|uniref:Uncharacterized protein n=1 Tax=Phytophthora megakarya TaxID=4795 RepID=A0A225UPM3_9STRA|nr:hypothetical protein PHMEG_00035055 [Phytophthora megakarya]